MLPSIIHKTCSCFSLSFPGLTPACLSPCALQLVRPHSKAARLLLPCTHWRRNHSCVLEGVGSGCRINVMFRSKRIVHHPVPLAGCSSSFSFLSSSRVGVGTLKKKKKEIEKSFTVFDLLMHALALLLLLFFQSSFRRPFYISSLSTSAVSPCTALINIKAVWSMVSCLGLLKSYSNIEAFSCTF